MKSEKLAWSVAGIALFIVAVGVIGVMKENYDMRWHRKDGVSLQKNWNMYKNSGLTMQYPAEYTLTTYPQDPSATLNKIATLQRSEDIKLEIFQGDYGWSPSVYQDEIDPDYKGADLKFEVLTVGEGNNVYSVPIYYPEKNEQAKAELYAIVKTMYRSAARR